MPGSHLPLCLLAAMTFKMGRWTNTKTQLLELLHIQNGYILQQKYMLEAHGSILHILSCCDETSNSQAKCDTARCNMVALPQGMRRASKVSASRPWPWRDLRHKNSSPVIFVMDVAIKSSRESDSSTTKPTLYQMSALRPLEPWSVCYHKITLGDICHLPFYGTEPFIFSKWAESNIFSTADFWFCLVAIVWSWWWWHNRCKNQMLNHTRIKARCWAVWQS